ncbi:MAG: putative transcriptional regulator [Aliidongia sp.]|nr:putative transcriptional regulator [Aliidongia sp.]
MPIVTSILDPSNPPRLSDEHLARLDAMSQAEIEEGALSDPDNPPITEEEFARSASAALVKSVRAGTGLSQAAFARRFHINAGRLRDLEQGRTAPDSALVAYLKVIAREPDAVSRAINAG